jgi:hypothetical protein
MAAIDYTDFYILDANNNKFLDTELIEDDLVRIIIQKYQVLVYTSQGDVLGENGLGTNLVELLYQTKLSSESVEEVIRGQISTYIPELSGTPYKLTVIFEQDPENYQDIMTIGFIIDEFEIINTIGSFG